MKTTYHSPHPWVRQAASQILHPSDRQAVMKELDGHMEDHIEALVEIGMSREEACARAEAAMGDPAEVGRQLAALHKPWLSWMLTAAKVWLAASVLLALVIQGQGSRQIRPLFTKLSDAAFDGQIEQALQEGFSAEACDAMAGFEQAGYWVRIERASVVQKDAEQYLLLEVRWTAERYRNDLDGALQRLYFTDGNRQKVSCTLLETDYSAKETLQVYRLELGPDAELPLHLCYTCGGTQIEKPIGGLHDA